MYSSRSAPPPLHHAPRGFSGNPNLHSRLLEPADEPLWTALRNEVIAALPDPDCYVREHDERAFFLQHCTPRGETIGVFHGDALVAYAMLGLPAVDDPDNLGVRLKLDASGRAATAHLSSCMVRPGWRGQGLQRTLLGARLALAHAHQRHLCMAVVSLHNHSSRHNMLRRGLHVAWVGDLDGLRRQIALIDLHHGLHVDTGDERLIDSDDLAAQQQAFADGYVGVGELRTDDQVHLRFLRRLVIQGVPL